MLFTFLVLRFYRSKKIYCFFFFIFKEKWVGDCRVVNLWCFSIIININTFFYKQPLFFIYYLLLFFYIYLKKESCLGGFKGLELLGKLLNLVIFFAAGLLIKKMCTHAKSFGWWKFARKGLAYEKRYESTG